MCACVCAPLPASCPVAVFSKVQIFSACEYRNNYTDYDCENVCVFVRVGMFVCACVFFLRALACLSVCAGLLFRVVYSCGLYKAVFMMYNSCRALFMMCSALL